MKTESKRKNLKTNCIFSNIYADKDHNLTLITYRNLSLPTAKQILLAICSVYT